MSTLTTLFLIDELETTFRQIRRDDDYYDMLLKLLGEDDRQMVERLGAEGAQFLIDENRFDWPFGFFLKRVWKAMERTKRIIDNRLCVT